MPSAAQHIKELKQELPASRYDKLVSHFYASYSSPTFCVSTKSWRERKLVYALATQHDLYFTKEFVDQAAFFCSHCEHLWYAVSSSAKKLECDVQYDTVCPSCKSIQYSECFSACVKTGNIVLSHTPQQQHHPKSVEAEPRQKLPMETIECWMQYVKKLNFNEE